MPGKKIAIIDYDAGNLRSVEKAFAYLGEKPFVTRDRKEILQADHVVLPGVGAFGDAMEKLIRFGLTEVIRESVQAGQPFLGICLGLQLLFERSEESPGVEGLGILRGEVVRIPAAEGLKIPHIGWNSLAVKKGAALFEGIADEAYVYFVHSYYLIARNEAEVAATADYGVRLHASVERGNLFACQFHPEKSGEVGLAILKNFAAYKA
ncbi:MAG: imidazole glycerol phosphate synthase subunit HisH [Lachnospiraceae bacterium]|nr:imidazole glycerol phosphate synthase subunit HisH [Lachnospiraceae bacterium]